MTVAAGPQRPIPGSEILRILVEECGWQPSDNDRQMFTHHYDTADHEPLEYRFMGKLGWGGKLHAQGNRLYVTCYPEDYTQARLQMIAAADQRLAELVRSYQ
jgi:hypothetical protein